MTGDPPFGEPALNPAVTVALLSSGRISSREAVEYWIGQAVGAIVAAFALFVVIKSRQGGCDLSEEGFGANGYGARSPDGYPLGGSLIIEVILTALLVFTVLSSPTGWPTSRSPASRSAWCSR